jgi:hypothetical protein
MKKFFTLVLLALTLFTTSVMASENYTHRASAFVGTHQQDSQNSLIYAGEYEYRPFSLIGVGVGVENSETTSQGQGVTRYLGTVNLHPLAPFSFGSGLRLGASLGESSLGDFLDGRDSTFRRYTFAYDLQVLNNLVLSPVLNLDRVNSEDTQTFGISVGFTL